MPAADKVVAIVIADLHLTLAPPACRAEEDWLEVQTRYLQQVRELAEEKGCPVLCAGDIFDRWNPTPELLCFALNNLPDDMICIPGQHDLPNHRMDLIFRSGYGVLKEAGKIVDLSEGSHMVFDKNIAVTGFGWGDKIQPPSSTQGGLLNIALIHRYCWIPGCEYPGAPADSQLNAYKACLKGYDVAVFGDNHKAFLKVLANMSILNCGGLIRRKMDEQEYSPGIGVIYADGSVKRKLFDTSLDQFHKKAKAAEEIPLNMQEFISELESLGNSSIDFRDMVKRRLDKEDLPAAVAEAIRESLP